MDQVFRREKSAGKRGEGMSEKRYVVRLDDDPQEPRYYVGSGYNHGKAFPYFYAGLTRKSTKLYKTRKGAKEGADRFGGRVGAVVLPDGSGDPVWVGYVIETQEDLEKRKRTQERKSDNVDAFDAQAEQAGAAGVELGAVATSAEPEGWRERQARIRREIAERRQRKQEQRKLADGSARDATTAKVAANAAGEQPDGPERDWIAGQIGIEDVLEEAGMADAADVMGAEE